jgi:hypothetical protein
MKEWMNEWTNERTNERNKERKKERKKERQKEIDDNFTFAGCEASSRWCEVKSADGLRTKVLDFSEAAEGKQSDMFSTEDIWLAP